jgi:flagellar protein FlgJ
VLYVNPLEAASKSGVTLNDGQKEKMAFQELEQVFLFMVLQEMRKTVSQEGLFGDNQMKQVFNEFMDDSLSKEWAASGQIGIAQQMEDQLRIQEMQHQIKQTHDLGR